MTAALFTGIYSCSDSEHNGLSYKKGGDIWFRNSGIQLMFNPEMYSKVYFHDEANSLNATGEDEFSRPDHFLVADGAVVKDFAVDYDRIGSEDIDTEFGKGKRLTLIGVATMADGGKLEKTLVTELYDKFPNTAIQYAQYKNTGSRTIHIDKDYSGFYRLDASLVKPDSQPFDFWSFQGSSLSWGLDYIIHITDGFDHENWMGVQPKTKTGGGVPLVDLWNEKMGMAVAHIETKPELVSFPVKVERDKKVNIGIEKDADVGLEAGDSYKTLRTAIITHALDYYDPLRTYTELMAAQGLVKPKPSDESYDAIWCGWGYLTDFSLDDIYSTLPKLKELGIKWVVIDDRWWDRYGDWNPRKFTFPQGEKQVKQFVDSLHHEGFRVKIWWAPTPVQPETNPTFTGSFDPGMAKVAKEHPEWLIMDKDGNYPRDCRGMYQFCPAVPEVQEYMKTLTTRFIKDWGFDGHKLDAYYVVPPCYNPAHHHHSPEESYQDLPKMLKVIYETSKAIKPYSVTELCNCGTNQDYFQSVYTDQPVVSDPTSVEQSRRRVKVFKALWGPEAPVYTDHVEHIRLAVDMNDKSDTARVGQDFATSIGPGGVPGTKFTWPAGPLNMQLTGQKEKDWEKWFRIYNEKMLSKGTYLNLYDVVYDKPETHVISKDQNLYYAFYADSWKGKIELRGLDDKTYKVYDYENGIDLGTVKGPVGVISPVFEKHLLIECTPVE